ncbi:hypothetical protein SHKM778_94320 (plasmid) [Streptomyces sp. KM77-8]|uniref:Uncharacterized protein n=1 Tax=Streptomyces haneummycinicus TaxID=3074435 RepID=A0AAT9I0Q4_9ACTN
MLHPQDVRGDVRVVLQTRLVGLLLAHTPLKGHCEQYDFFTGSPSRSRTNLSTSARA